MDLGGARRGDLWWYTYAPLVDRDSILADAHGSHLVRHLGTCGTLDMVCRTWYWLGLSRLVQFFKAACRTAAPFKKRTLLQKWVPSSLWDWVAMDLMGPLPLNPRGNRHVVALITLKGGPLREQEGHAQQPSEAGQQRSMACGHTDSAEQPYSCEMPRIF